MQRCGVSKRIDPLFGQNPRTIAIVPHGFATLREMDSEIGSTLARVQAGFDRQLAANGGADRGKLAIKAKIEIALGTFAQTIQQNRRGAPAGKLETYYIKYLGLLVARIRHVRDDSYRVFVEKETD